MTLEIQARQDQFSPQRLALGFAVGDVQLAIMALERQVPLSARDEQSVKTVLATFQTTLHQVTTPTDVWFFVRCREQQQSMQWLLVALGYEMRDPAPAACWQIEGQTAGQAAGRAQSVRCIPSA